MRRGLSITIAVRPIAIGLCLHLLRLHPESLRRRIAIGTGLLLRDGGAGGSGRRLLNTVRRWRPRGTGKIGSIVRAAGG